jgi:two-component system response regulator HydG
VETAAAVGDGLARLEPGEAGGFDLVITDLKLPDGSGMDVVERAGQALPGCQVLVTTAYASVDTAVEAMRRGAFHYLSKPFGLDVLLAEVEKALEHGRVLSERLALRERLSAQSGLGRILGSGPAIVAMRELIREVARADSPVLITGETGTGKELVANAIHYEGTRAGGPLVKVNCAALSETLLESELFGHEKGAFTGAERDRAGRFERAHGGTLFLDEISEMGSHVQAKLLRVLGGESFERVGGDRPVRADARVVSATNRDPEEAVAGGQLRRDLYYRLNVVRVEVPPLRERREDVPVLARHFAATFAERLGKRIAGPSDAALAALGAHDWPGNVRELENCIERAVVLARGEVLEPGDLPPQVSGAAPGEPAPGDADELNLQEVERRTILRALEQSDWNKARAAGRLGIFASSLYKKMKRLEIPLKPDS